MWPIPMRRLRLPRRSLCGLALYAECTAFAMTGQSPILSVAANSSLEACQTIQDNAARLFCLGIAGSDSSLNDSWRMIRTPRPAGGRDVVSIMKSADITESDPDFAGLMLRCRDTSTEVLIVLLRPLLPHEQPNVVVEAGSARTQFTANVVPPGALVLLPPEAVELTTEPWQATSKFAITIAHEHAPIHGVVDLTGVAQALQVLRSNCPMS
jgi:hypothetical protein